ncbi:sulfatase-like hydrolase/transferase [Candidatus Marsarchaeota archaeon]|nr:sulfatase-like hydrolase/transferase [Candidatus Marsarchaeota archaeon]
MKRNIFVLLMDTARADDAYCRETMPSVNRMAEYGTRYANAVSPGTWTAPTHASLFANLKVSSIKEASQNFFKGGSEIDPWMVRTKFLSRDASTLAGKLSKEGYYSVLFSNNPFLTSNTNLAVGFDKIYDIWLESNAKYNRKTVDRVSFVLNGGASTRSKIFKASYAISKLIPKPALDRIYLNLRVRLDRSVAKADGTHKLDRGASDTNRLLSKYLKYGYNYAPQFMFINYIEAHENYPVKDKSIVQDKWLYLSGKEELSDSVKKEFHNAYLRRLRYLDTQIANTINALKSQGMLDSATVVITSDHGQLFGEHGLLYHAMPPYEGLSKVPLISVNYENGRIVPDNEVVEEPVSLLSLHSSILNLAKGKYDRLNGNIRRSKYVMSEHTGISEGWDEHLLSLLKPKSNTANQIYKAKTKHNKKATAIYNGKFKLMHFFGNKLDELYNLEVDPQETSNIIGYNRGIANAMLSAAI